jgi:hypothetical protein
MSHIQPRSSFEDGYTIGCGRCPVDPVGEARYARYNVAGRHFAVGLNPLRLHSPCDPLAKPGLLAACIAPHRYLSGAAISPRVCIGPTLRPNGSSPTGIGGGDFLSFHHHASLRTAISGSLSWGNISPHEGARKSLPGETHERHLVPCREETLLSLRDPNRRGLQSSQLRSCWSTCMVIRSLSH